MARRKDQSPLFEIIRGTQTGKDRPRIELPPWLAAGSDTAADRSTTKNTSSTSTPASKGASVSASSVSPAAPQGTKPATPKPAADPRGSSGSSAASQGNQQGKAASQSGPSTGWLETEIDFRVSRMRLGVMGLSAVAVMVLVYLGAYRLGMVATQDQAGDGQQIASLAGGSGGTGGTGGVGVADGTGAVGGAVSGDEVLGGRETAGSSGSGAASSPLIGAAGGVLQGQRVVGRGLDTRESGMNYYVLETMAERARSYGEEIVAYLAANGVDAAVVPANDNGSSSMVTVVVLEGFASPSSPGARRLKDQLLHLGRGWKQQGGARDWHDLYGRLYKGSDD